jgi:hypothetical protein
MTELDQLQIRPPVRSANATKGGMKPAIQSVYDTRPHKKSPRGNMWLPRRSVRSFSKGLDQVYQPSWSTSDRNSQIDFGVAHNRNCIQAYADRKRRERSCFKHRPDSPPHSALNRSRLPHPPQCSPPPSPGVCAKPVALWRCRFVLRRVLSR